MAALTMTPTVRQPFASLDTPRVRPLLKSKMNLKNQQNGAILSGKRQPLSEVDTENIDPTIFNSSTKRKRGSDEDEHEPIKNTTKPMKTSRITLTTPCKPFARRSTIAKSRPEPASKKSVNRPFSLAAALASGKPTSQPASKAPSGWSFDIYVDSEQEEMTNLMQHSTCVLDISDDEGKGESTTRGKENIPPAELGIDLPRSRQRESPAAAARKSVMMEESRAPLGDLNAADYYGEDCHAFSYTIVYDDEETDATSTRKTPLPTLPRSGHSRSKLSSVSSISSLLEATTPVEDAKSGPSEAEVEVWESGSAVEESA
ncbi:hypothetical protein AARAC_008229 [Aspergillus arachidicola]|uniref:Thymidylate kinase n=1 Tax=Aspergillus arachidicola TaxID=656916 RepID=A0A2G7EMF3_9EURO|nr:hypothetical protein AARAC_008229 [Aspergillus arachidicola]